MIARIEANLIEVTRQLFGRTLRTVDSLPGPLNLDVLKDMLAHAPAVYYAFLGGTRGDVDGYIDGRFDAFICTRHVNRDSRRLGDQTQIGAYDIIARLLPILDGHIIHDVGRFRLTRVTNLFSLTLDKQMGAALYGISLQLPNMPFIDDDLQATLNDFITFHADYERDLATDGEPVATDNLTLPQE